MVTVFYLWRRNKPIWFAAIPMVIMVIMPAWALLWQMFNDPTGWFWPLAAMAKGEESWAWSNTHLLFTVGLTTFGLQIWMVIEAITMFAKAKGVLEEALPPLPDTPRSAVAGVGADARSC
jgi:carbon starvation protein